MTAISPSALAQLAPVQSRELLGSWHIQLTNFPMWLSGNKLRPSLNYGDTGTEGVLDDVVRYASKSGNVSEIKGTDRQDPANSAHFTWRGKGWLWPFVSEWYVVHLDRQAGVAAIYFTRTLFTPAGIDIVSRDAAPPSAAVEAARAACRAVPGLAPMVETLQAIR